MLFGLQLIYNLIAQLFGVCSGKVRGKGFNNTWNEVVVVVVVAGRLIIVPSWLQLTGSSVLCLEEVVKGSQTSCTQQVCLTHLQLGQSGCVCACVCGIIGQGQPISLQTITSHRAKYIPTPPQPPVCKVVWCGNSGEGGGLAAVQTEASEARWRKTCSTLIWLHFTHVRERLSARAQFNVTLFLKVSECDLTFCKCAFRSNQLVV